MFSEQEICLDGGVGMGPCRDWFETSRFELDARALLSESTFPSSTCSLLYVAESSAERGCVSKKLCAREIACRVTPHTLRTTNMGLILPGVLVREGAPRAGVGPRAVRRGIGCTGAD